MIWRGFVQLSIYSPVRLLMVFCALSAWAEADGRDQHGERISREAADARNLFVRFWKPGVPSPAGGDGLGPLYNEQSCVGCHNQGGVGGAGDSSKDVKILVAFAGVPRGTTSSLLFQGELEDLHPGFRNRSSVVLHRHAVSEADETRLREIDEFVSVQTRDDMFTLTTSHRNTPALFGSGLIDSISATEILEGENRKFEQFPETSGRVSRLRDGRIGRFGWKGQTATLSDFVLGACSNELGLEVRGHHQASLTAQRDFKPAELKFDLSDDETVLLTRFVAGLPRPRFRAACNAETIRAGRLVFERIGCASCHLPKMAGIDGLYSDLLLHDLGDRFQDLGMGYGGSPATRVIVDRRRTEIDTSVSGDPTPTEWRTPPLWGVADSAPYLHDGRANTLDEAIRLHGGEAEKTSKRYSELTRIEQQALLGLLHSLRTADEADRTAPRSKLRAGHPRG
jgi:CxxC motif-containing protein (DUF1111 family)